MKCLIVLFAAVAAASAQYLVPAPYSAHYLAPVAPLRTQFHAQDELGSYTFGYSGGPSSKFETKTGGVTQGNFNYVDAHGLVQSRSYVSDALGFRVAGTDIPVDANTPLVAGAPAHPAVVLARRKRAIAYAAPHVAYAAPHVAYAAPHLAYAAPHVSYAAPAVYAAPYAYHGVPADTPEVAIAKVNHYARYNYESLRNAHLAY